MAVKLRLRRMGSKQKPFYRIVAADFKLQQRYEKPSEVSTLFTQLMWNYKSKFWQLDNNEKEPFESTLAYERSYDCGGPMRDIV